MKGITYSGILHMPDHPDADLHGLIRVVIREASMVAVLRKLECFGLMSVGIGLWTAQIWQPSKSHVELLATERHYGELMATSLALQYLKPENYRVIPPSLLEKYRNEQSTRARIPNPARPDLAGLPVARDGPPAKRQRLAPPKSRV